jgi:hypothetical protein
VERSYERSDERLKKLDEYGLECTQEVVNVCKLEDALVCDNKDKLEVIYKCPFDGISVLLVLLFCCATLYESITDKAVDRGCRGRGQLGSLWGE